MQFSSPPGFQDFLTVQDNSSSYQGFQEVTGICGKIQDLGKSFKIFYTGCSLKQITTRDAVARRYFSWTRHFSVTTLNILFLETFGNNIFIVISVRKNGIFLHDLCKLVLKLNSAIKNSKWRKCLLFFKLRHSAKNTRGPSMLDILFSWISSENRLDCKCSWRSW